MRAHPFLGFSLIAVSFTCIIAYAILLHQDIAPWIVYLIAINLTTFLLFWYDWLISPAEEERTRIPEWVLLGLVAVGGTIGGLLGMFVIGHKRNTRRKWWFQLRFLIIVIIQTMVIFCYPLRQPNICNDVFGSVLAL